MQINIQFTIYNLQFTVTKNKKKIFKTVQIKPRKIIKFNKNKYKSKKRRPRRNAKYSPEAIQTGLQLIKEGTSLRAAACCNYV